MPRIHVGIVLGDSHTRSALVATEHVEMAPALPTGPWGRMRHEVGHSERLESAVEVVRARIVDLARSEWPSDLCFFTDCTTAGGFALYKLLRVIDGWPEQLHRPHGYFGRGRDRQALLTAILQAMGADELAFDPPGGDARKSELVKALENRDVGDDGRLAARTEDEAMLVALGLTLIAPRHSHLQPARYRNRDGSTALSRLASGDPYLRESR